MLAQLHDLVRDGVGVGGVCQDRPSPPPGIRPRRSGRYRRPGACRACRRGCSQSASAGRCAPRSSSRSRRRTPARLRAGGVGRAGARCAPGARAASPSPRTRTSSSASPRSSASASVVVCHSRVVASFEAGWSSRSTTMASTRSRSGERFGAMSRSRPRRRVMASRASTWPWGRERSMVKASSGGTRRWPLSTRRRDSTFSAGQSVRLASVRLRTRPPSRQPSRSRTAGRELRLGTVSTYMGTTISCTPGHVKLFMFNYMGTRIICNLGRF